MVVVMSDTGEWPPHEDFVELHLEKDAIETLEDVRELWLELVKFARKEPLRTIVVRLGDA